jgi:hypothetical protein
MLAMYGLLIPDPNGERPVAVGRSQMAFFFIQAYRIGRESKCGPRGCKISPGTAPGAAMAAGCRREGGPPREMVTDRHIDVPRLFRWYQERWFISVNEDRTDGHWRCCVAEPA